MHCTIADNQVRPASGPPLQQPDQVREMPAEQGGLTEAAEDGPDVVDVRQRLAVHDALPPVGARDHRRRAHVPRRKTLKIRGKFNSY